MHNKSVTMENTTSMVTRSGRQVKKPTRYEPVEKVTDDFSECDSDIYSSDDEYNSPREIIKSSVNLESDGETLGSSDSDSSEDECVSDADDQGNLKDFVVYSESESENENELNN